MGPSPPCKPPHISRILSHHLALPASSPLPTPCPNVKWSRVVPTGVSPSSGAVSLDECHRALVALNPAYASLLITLCPSWVCSPSSYSTSAVSSLMFAFKDPDGSSPFLFWACGVVKKWKQKPPLPPNMHSHPPTSSGFVIWASARSSVPVVFESPVRSGFLTLQWVDRNRNRSRADPDVGRT
jgi:hypothetical protein